MSKLEDLINKLCPNGVNYKTIGELHFDKKYIMRGIRITKKDLIEDGQYKVYGGGEDIIFGYYDKYNIKRDTVTINVAGSVGFVDYITEDSWIVDSRYAFFTNQMNRKFLYYALKNKENELRSFVKGAIPGINMDLLMKVCVPIPPMELQCEIVRILDNFTELTAELTVELTAELTARKKQYEYYRDKLLSFVNDEINWVTLGEITIIERGIRVVKSQLNKNGIYPVYQNSLTPLGNHVESNCKSKSTFLIAAGAAGEVGYSYNDFWAADDCFYFVCDSNIIIQRYLYFVLLTQKPKILNLVRKASIPRISRDMLGRLIIPILDIEKQKHIVEILDKFNIITEDILKGISAEIESRQKQYEYYRDKLLTFKELEV